MAHRSFVDREGRRWEVWDVIPSLGNRRRAERRVSNLGTPDGIERRQAERRSGEGRRPALSAGLDRGWLCFDCGEEKRRLTPIPASWDLASEAELAGLLLGALRSPRHGEAAAD